MRDLFSEIVEGLTDLTRRRVEEGISGNGFEGLGGHGEGFEIANQGVTRRWPGEGPKVNGGRSQSQELDATDQPQYVDGEEEPEPGWGQFFKEERGWSQAKDPDGFETQVAQGITSGGSDVTDEGTIPDMHRMFTARKGQ